MHAQALTSGDTRPIERVQRALCFLAILFASGDLWPSVTLGFTFRFSQLCLLAAFALSPVLLYHSGVRLFPGWYWLYGFLLWLVISLPFSQLLGRSIGYTIWAVTDFLIIFVFVQVFRTEVALIRLVRFFLISFVLLALFGLVQFALGLAGIGVLVAQWWIPGVLPRINGLSYEPSYYATYLLGGWVFSVYLLERGAQVPSVRLQRMCAITTTAALILATSRLGWAMMILWAILRLSRLGLQTLVRGRIRRRNAGLIVASPLLLGGLLIVASPVLPYATKAVNDAAFLLAGVGLFGAPSHSVSTRAGDLHDTWQAFLEHPVMGTGIGALPAEIAAQRGGRIRTLEDAKPNEGMSIFIELLASTGLIGAGLLAAFGVTVLRQCQRTAPSLPCWRKELLSAAGWAVVWLLFALQFSQNFLRIWLFIAIAVLMCCLTATAGPLRVIYRRHPILNRPVAPRVRSPSRPMQRPLNTSR